MAKIISTPELLALNKQSIREKQVRTIPKAILGMLDIDGTHVVGTAMLHQDRAVRCELYLKLLGQTEAEIVWFDMNIGEFNSLRDHTPVENNGG